MIHMAASVDGAQEIFPTRLRSRGSGLAAGISKAAGVVIIALVAVSVAAPSIADTALMGALPMALAAIAVALFGPETRNRQLEEITAEQLGVPEARVALAGGLASKRGLGSHPA